MRTPTEQEVFRWRVLPLSVSLRHSFHHIMESQKGVWRDQLFCHTTDHKFIAAVPNKDFKYLDPDKIAAEMMSVLQSINALEAIYTCVRSLELESGPIQTYNINYIGPACWDGGALCAPYVYSAQHNRAWTIETTLFDRIADEFNTVTQNILRTNFYAVSDISYKERVRLLTSKGYKVFDSNDVLESRVSATIATIGTRLL